MFCSVLDTPLIVIPTGVFPNRASSGIVRSSEPVINTRAVEGWHPSRHSTYASRAFGGSMYALGKNTVGYRVPPEVSSRTKDDSLGIYRSIMGAVK